MKKLFVIGQVNILLEEMSNYLANHFEVEIWNKDRVLDDSIREVSKPEIIVLSVLGLGEENTVILQKLKDLFGDIPLVCLLVSEEDAASDMLTGFDKVKTLTLPAGNERILEVIYELLGYRYDKESRVVLGNCYKKKCVLAIDDNALQLRMLNEMLKNEYDVMMANSAIKALTMIGKRVPDIILLDYDMPMCDGKMAMQMIREIEETKEVPIIFLTAVKDAAHIKDVLELHPAGYLLKPAKSDMIRQEIEKHIK